jgi:hypothetical protein
VLFSGRFALLVDAFLLELVDHEALCVAIPLGGLEPHLKEFIDSLGFDGLPCHLDE